MIWGGEVLDEQNLPEHGPAILVSNHLGALGPIAVAACVQRRLYPWVAAEMLDERLASEYLRWDFIERTFDLNMPFSLWAANALSKISVPLLRSVDCVPVYSGTNEFHITAERSMDLLLQDQFLLIFPEDPTQPADPRYSMTPFKKGFIRLAELYFERTGQALRFYPLAVHEQSRLVQVGKPITFNPHAPLAGERVRIKNVLEKMIHEMYLELGGNTVLGIPLPH